MDNREAIGILNKVFLKVNGTLAGGVEGEFLCAISTLAHSVGILEVVDPVGLELCDMCKKKTLRRFFDTKVVKPDMTDWDTEVEITKIKRCL